MTKTRRTEIVTAIEIIEVFPANTQPGIDVSHYQGAVNWPLVASSGVAFAFAKASEGVGDALADPTFPDNWAGMQAESVLRGAYHFFHPNLDPASQVEAFMVSLANANDGSPILGPGDLPAVLDLEITDSVAAADIIAGAAAWLEMVELITGKRPLLYTYVDFWLDTLGNPANLSQYPLWIAQTQVSAPTVPGGWADWTFWQFDAEPLNGIPNGAVDLDAFNGTLEQLLLFAGADALPFAGRPYR